MRAAGTKACLLVVPTMPVMPTMPAMTVEPVTMAAEEEADARTIVIGITIVIIIVIGIVVAGTAAMAAQVTPMPPAAAAIMARLIYVGVLTDGLEIAGNAAQWDGLGRHYEKSQRQGGCWRTEPIPHSHLSVLPCYWRHLERATAPPRLLAYLDGAQASRDRGRSLENM